MFLSKEQRVEIFRQTVDIVNSGGYVLNGKKIAVDKTEIAAKTEFFDAKFSSEDIECSQDTKFSVIEADCLEVAELLSLKACYNFLYSLGVYPVYRLKNLPKWDGVQKFNSSLMFFRLMPVDLSSALASSMI